MKTKQLITLFVFFGLFINANTQISSGKKTIKFNNAPELIVSNIILVDENNDKIADGGEKYFFKPSVQNKGKSAAKTVNIKTKIVGGITDALSFEKSVYVGNIAIGEKKEVEIPINPGISLKDGLTSFQFIAQEANGHDSKPASYDLKVQAKLVPLAVNWYYPVMPSTTVNEASYLIKACILSSKPISKVSIYLNNKLIEEDRAFKLIKTNTCNHHLEKEIALQKGENTVKIVVTNTKTTATSEIRTINYADVAYEHRLALIIGNSKYK